MVSASSSPSAVSRVATATAARWSARSRPRWRRSFHRSQCPASCSASRARSRSVSLRASTSGRPMLGPGRRRPAHTAAGRNARPAAAAAAAVLLAALPRKAGEVIHGLPEQLQPVDLAFRVLQAGYAAPGAASASSCSSRCSLNNSSKLSAGGTAPYQQHDPHRRPRRAGRPVSSASWPTRPGRVLGVIDRDQQPSRPLRQRLQLGFAGRRGRAARRSSPGPRPPGRPPPPAGSCRTRPRPLQTTTCSGLAVLRFPLTPVGQRPPAAVRGRRIPPPRAVAAGSSPPTRPHLGPGGRHGGRSGSRGPRPGPFRGPGPLGLGRGRPPAVTARGRHGWPPATRGNAAANSAAGTAKPPRSAWRPRVLSTIPATSPAWQVQQRRAAEPGQHQPPLQLEERVPVLSDQRLELRRRPGQRGSRAMLDRVPGQVQAVRRTRPAPAADQRQRGTRMPPPGHHYHVEDRQVRQRVAVPGRPPTPAAAPRRPRARLCAWSCHRTRSAAAPWTTCPQVSTRPGATKNPEPRNRPSSSVMHTTHWRNRAISGFGSSSPQVHGRLVTGRGAACPTPASPSATHPLCPRRSGRSASRS